MAVRLGQGNLDDADNMIGADALRALEPIKILDATPKLTYANTEIRRRLPSPSIQRRITSLTETSIDLDAPLKITSQPSPSPSQASPTVFYLAYGSNLSAEAFQGKRGIRPIAQLNVLVPELDLTFDLAGVPYVEPCFANTKYRSPKPFEAGSEKSPSLSPPHTPNHKYHKLRWHKGLVGVVYEVTREDFARIIASEGGGASYRDILVLCYELPQGEDTVPTHPTSQPFKAHTLYSPAFSPGSDAPRYARRSRPDPNYAQASKRYLKLIMDGADEHNLPEEYQDYLRQLRPYVATTQRQKLGRTLFAMAWFPFFSVLFALTKLTADKKGKTPAWLIILFNASFRASWGSYELVFKRLFGDGERTIGDDEDDDDDNREPKARVRKPTD